MRKITSLALVLGALWISASCSDSGSQLRVDPLTVQPTDSPDSAFEWLEDVEGAKPLKWVTDHNATTLAVLKGDSRFAAIHAETKAIATSKDRIPVPGLLGDWVYNHWQDANHKRGLLRRVTPEEFNKPTPAWELVLDLDALSAAEGKDWVYKGMLCLEPAYDRCLLSLSLGGKDAVVVREFSMAQKQFVAGGFEIPEAKSNFAWVNQDLLAVGSDFGPGALTDSGYPRTTRLWARSTPLANAPEVFAGKPEDVSVELYAGQHSTLGRVVVLLRALSFFEVEYSLLFADGSVKKTVLPTSSEIKAFYRDRLIVLLKEDLLRPGKTDLVSGSVVAVPLESATEPAAFNQLEEVWTPSATTAVTGVAATRAQLVLTVVDNVRGRLLSAEHKAGVWELASVEIPDNGEIELVSTDDASPYAYLSYESPLTPSQLLRLEDGKPELVVAKQLPPQFDASQLQVEQRFVTSRDGTKVPYFEVGRRDRKMDGQNPTLLYGYGGFEISLTPSYLGMIGKVWLERGGTYVLANIRGGGEYGPSWHQAALKENRQKAYDDFIAIADDLVNRKVTSPRRLGIQGGSNGGLLVGAVMVQRPDLFHAVLCEVPLLDMLRFHKLLAGASWMGEYGNPDIADEAAVIARYSPFQNLRRASKYPKIFFMTSTKDDRVHPGHARKMAARMEEMGHSFMYFERTDGGHGGATNPLDRAENRALGYTYLFQQLVD